jgi:dihydrofolate reductase
VTRVTLVVAVSQNNVIGAKGGLPWRLSDDLRRFKALTWGKPIVMGRKTFDSIGKPLPGRFNIVVTRDSAWHAAGAVRAGGVDDALRLAAGDGSEVMVVGGAEIYAAALPVAARIHLTRVGAVVEGEARLPKINPADWRKTCLGSAPKGPRNDYPCRFFVLDRLLCATVGC